MLFLPAALQRTLVFLGLSALMLMALDYLLGEHHGMGMMPSAHAHRAGDSGPEAWSGFLPALLMWAIMMFGMMTPSVMPMVFGMLRTGPRTPQRHPYRRTLAFLLGYFLVCWCTARAPLPHSASCGLAVCFRPCWKAKAHC